MMFALLRHLVNSRMRANANAPDAVAPTVQNAGEEGWGSHGGAFVPGFFKSQFNVAKITGVITKSTVTYSQYMNS